MSRNTWRGVAGTNRTRVIDIEQALLDSDDDSDLDEIVDGEDAGWLDEEEREDGSDTEEPVEDINDPEEQVEGRSDTGEPVEDVDGAPQRKRRRLLKDKLVHDIESCLNIESYDEYKIPEEKKEYKAVLEKKTRHQAEVSITWQNYKITRVGRQGRENVMRTPGGVIGEAKEADTPPKCFLLFISEDILDEITKQTNASITRYYASLEADMRQRIADPQSKYTWLKLTDKVEMKAYIGLSYLKGAFQQNYWNYHRIFADMIGHPVFLATMSMNRFCFLNANFSMDDDETRGERWKTDRLAATRDLFEDWNNNCSAAYQMDQFGCIDECLYPCRNQVAIKQYNPNKPAKYGLLVKELNSVSVPYTHHSEVYAGKPKEDGPYYVKSVEDITLRLVDRYSQFCDMQGRNITNDNLYTSISLGH